jgi:hypothetical protein
VSEQATDWFGFRFFNFLCLRVRVCVSFGLQFGVRALRAWGFFGVFCTKRVDSSLPGGVGFFTKMPSTSLFFCFG